MDGSTADGQAEGEGAGRLLDAVDAEVIGALRDAVAFTRQQFEIELNGVADNPIFDARNNVRAHRANFQGTPMTLPLDMVRRGSRWSRCSPRAAQPPAHPASASGCPQFLTKGAGMYSGLMLSQYTADMAGGRAAASSAHRRASSRSRGPTRNFVSMG